jgi:putative membrane protein
MFVNYRGSMLGIIGWQWRYLAFFTAVSTVVVAIVQLGPASWRPYLELPGLPLGVIGGAIGIFVSFRTNSAYDRWWEGRKLWGTLINASRHWASQVLAYTSPDQSRPSELHQQLIRRHIGYVHVLRCALRKQPFHEDEDVVRFLDAGEVARLQASTNAPHLLLYGQLIELQEQVRAGKLDLFHQQLMDQTLRDILDVQGGCERIKNTPFPRGYGYIAERLILAFGAMLPMGIAQELGWVTIPMTSLVCSGFLLISEVGRVLEDPFTMFWPALPLSALSKTIEVNLRERLGESSLPALPVPDQKGILM